MKNRMLCFALAAVIWAVAGLSFPFEVSADAVVEAAVREAFIHAPVMIEIARCESKFRQFSDNGSPLYGGWGGGMIGVFQFYDSVHRTAAAALGFDLKTLAGNIGYAKHVYALSGTAPWNSARDCWENAAITADADISGKELDQLQEHIALLMKEVARLQMLLEAQKVVSR